MTDYPQLELLIGGEAIGAAARDTIEVLNPATGEAMAALPKATAADLDAALEAASNGFKSWRATSADEREAVLRKDWDSPEEDAAW